MSDEHIVEQQPSAAGWMVFSACEGEDPQPVAFFMGPRAKELAAELWARRDADGDPVIFDPGIAPAVLVSDGFGGLFAANHYDDAEGKAALIREHEAFLGAENMLRAWDDQDAEAPTDTEGEP